MILTISGIYICTIYNAIRNPESVVIWVCIPGMRLRYTWSADLVLLKLYFPYFFKSTFVRVGDSMTSLSSGASAGSKAIFLAYQVMAGFAEIP